MSDAPLPAIHVIEFLGDGNALIRRVDGSERLVPADDVRVGPARDAAAGLTARLADALMAALPAAGLVLTDRAWFNAYLDERSAATAALEAENARLRAALGLAP